MNKFQGQTPRFHTPIFEQMIEAELDEHRRATSMCQHATKYNVQMTHILLRLFDLEIFKKIDHNEKDIFI